MANFFQTLFGGGKKQDAVQTYFPSQDPRYQLVQKNLEDIIAKRGYGYTPEMISSTTAPYATARREGIKNYEIPLISAQASSRGLGRSTIPVNRIALSSQEGERDIEQRIADLTQRSEALKADQYQSALSGESGLASAEIMAQQQARDRAAAASETNRMADKAMTQNATLLGAQMVSPFLSEGLKSSVGAITNTPYQADWNKAIDSSLKGGDNSALVKTSKGTSTPDLTTILSLISKYPMLLGG